MVVRRHLRLRHFPSAGRRSSLQGVVVVVVVVVAVLAAVAEQAHLGRRLGVVEGRA